MQEVVKKTWPEDLAARERALLDHIRARALFLWDGWVQHEHRWELAPLTACADQWLERDGDDGPWLAYHVASPLQQLGNFAAAERLNRRAVERTRPDNPSYALRLNNLAVLLRATNRLAEAEPLYRRALAITRRRTAPTTPTSPPPSTTWRSCCGPPTAWPRPSRCTGGRWRSARRRTARTIPDVATALNNLA